MMNGEVLAKVPITDELRAELESIVIGDLLGRAGRESEELTGRTVPDRDIVEGSETNLRLQQFSSDHSSDITKVLQNLVSKGHLVKQGYGRWASYRLSEHLARSGHKAEGTPDTTAGNSGHKEAAPDTIGEAASESEPLNDPGLLALAATAREKSRMPPEQMRQLILRLCSKRFLTPRQIGGLLNRSPEGIQRHSLRPLDKWGAFALHFPEEPNHPNQAYRTTPDTGQDDD